jgi:hypothetical protein
MKRPVVSYVWVAEYCWCHYEAGFTVLGLFRRREDARRALRKHRNAELCGDKRRPSQHWRVQRYEVQ